MAMPQSLRQGAGEKGGGGQTSTGAASHLDALESLARSPRARNALNTLRSELLGDGGGPSKSSKPSSANAKSEALARFSK